MRNPLFFMAWLPVIELVLLIALGASIGFWMTLLWVVGTGFVGIWLLRSAGPRAYQRAIDQARAQGPNATPSVDALGLFATWFGGILLILPGPLTDLIGLILVVPLLRRLTFGLWLAQRLQGVVVARTGAQVYEGQATRVYDVDPDRRIDRDDSDRSGRH